MSNDKNSKINVDELAYADKTYDDLSLEFKSLFPLAIKAFHLIPRMYNRLTLVDHFTHKAAVKKIIKDHSHMTGFSPRNIRRYLPLGNPLIPRRIRTPRPKSCVSRLAEKQGLSLSQLEQESFPPDYELTLGENPNRRMLEQQCSLKVQELDGVPITLSLRTRRQSPPGHTFAISKEKLYDFRMAMALSTYWFYVTFDDAGNLSYVGPDTIRTKNRISNFIGHGQ